MTDHFICQAQPLSFDRHRDGLRVVLHINDRDVAREMREMLQRVISPESGTVRLAVDIGMVDGANPQGRPLHTVQRLTGPRRIELGDANE